MLMYCSLNTWSNNWESIKKSSHAYNLDENEIFYGYFGKFLSV